MRVFGNLMNRMEETVGSPTPEVGMGATILMFSDTYACTVIKIHSPKRVTVQEDTAIRTDKNGMSESQDYTFTPNPEGPTYVVTLRKNGQWIIEGQSMKQGTVVRLGGRRRYFDFGF